MLLCLIKKYMWVNNFLQVQLKIVLMFLICHHDMECVHIQCVCERVLSEEHKRVGYTIAWRNRELSSMWCVEFSASSFGSDITHNIAAGSALKSPTAGALRNPQLASHFQTIKCRAGFHYSTVGSGQYFHSLSPICLQRCTEFHSL